LIFSQQTLLQTLHRIGQWKQVREDGKRKGHGGYRKEDPAEKDHGEPEEIGQGHGLKDLFDTHGDEDSKKGEGKAGKKDGENKRKRVFDREAHHWDYEDGYKESNDQPKKSTSEGFTKKDRPDMERRQEESLQSTYSFLKGDHNSGHRSA